MQILISTTLLMKWLVTLSIPHDWQWLSDFVTLPSCRQTPSWLRGERGKARTCSSCVCGNPSCSSGSWRTYDPIGEASAHTAPRLDLPQYICLQEANTMKSFVWTWANERLTLTMKLRNLTSYSHLNILKIPKTYFLFHLISLYSVIISCLFYFMS